MIDKSAPVEFCRVPKEYPCYLHVFQYEASEHTTVIPRHWHQNLEIAYRRGYSGCLYINGKKKELSADSVEIINSYDVHEIHKYGYTHGTVILISISYEFLKSIIPDYDNYFFIADREKDEFKRIILEMKKVHGSGKEWSHLKMNSLLYELIYVMMKNAKLKSKSIDVHLSIEDTRIRNNLMNYIRTNIGRIKSVQDLSGQLGYSREHLSRTVKRLFAINARTLLAQARMDVAMQIYRDGTVSMQEAAKLSGYPSYRAFLDAYRRYNGYTRYREQ